MVLWWGSDIEEMNGIYTRRSMSSVLGLGVGVGVGTGAGLNVGVGLGARFNFGFSTGVWVCVCVCVCVCAARWLSLHQYKYVFIPHRVRGSLRFDGFWEDFSSHFGPKFLHFWMLKPLKSQCWKTLGFLRVSGTPGGGTDGSGVGAGRAPRLWEY